MKSIETRLSALEKAAAATELVTVEFKNSENSTSEMDLLRAVQLLLSGKVRTITVPWKPGEREQYMSETVQAIESYIEARRGANR